MPELPDVEVYKRYLEATSLKKRITGVAVSSREVLRGVSARGLSSVLRGRRLVSARRHGKYLFAEAEGDGWLVMHFGMTGRLRYFRDSGSEPGHTRVRIDLENGFRLAYVSQRKLGFVSMAGDPAGFIEKKGLGPDALGIGFEKFRDIIGARRGSVKSALMDQAALAGVGNLYSDEALFHAGVHPRAAARDLGEKGLRALYRSMKRVLEKAVEANVEPGRMPRSWLLPRRGDKDALCPRCGSALKTAKVSGRTAYFCPGHQKR